MTRNKGAEAIGCSFLILVALILGMVAIVAFASWAIASAIHLGFGG